MFLKQRFARREISRNIKSQKRFSNDSGLTYIGLLIFIAITSIGLSVAGISWQYQVRSEKEQELLFVGGQFRAAIYSYYASTPSAAKVYPASLNDLLLDNRFPNIKRHLRQIYNDPMTGKPDWGLVKQQGRIVGVFSRSLLVPFKHNSFKYVGVKNTDAQSYRDWVFGQSDGLKSELK